MSAPRPKHYVAAIDACPNTRAYCLIAGKLYVISISVGKQHIGFFYFSHGVNQVMLRQLDGQTLGTPGTSPGGSGNVLPCLHIVIGIVITVHILLRPKNLASVLITILLARLDNVAFQTSANAVL